MALTALKVIHLQYSKMLFVALWNYTQQFLILIMKDIFMSHKTHNNVLESRFIKTRSVPNTHRFTKDNGMSNYGKRLSVIVKSLSYQTVPHINITQ